MIFPVWSAKSTLRLRNGVRTAAAFRAIHDLELDRGDGGLLGHRDIVPPVSATVRDEIAGLEGTAKRHPLAGP